MTSPSDKFDPPGSAPDGGPPKAPTPAKPYQPTWDDRLEDMRDYLGPAVAVVIILLMGAVVAWYYFKGDAAKPQPAAARGGDTPSPLVGPGGDDETRLATYDHLVERQTELMRAQRSIDTDQMERLQRLERERGELRSRVLRARSRQAEADAVAAEGAGQEAVASGKWEEALKLHREAYANRPVADAAENAREARLAARADDARATGLQRTVVREREQAERAEQAENWAEAAQSYAAWRAAQAAINERMPASRFADARVLLRIDAALTSIKTVELAAAVQRNERAAEIAERTGDITAATASIQVALKTQQSINTLFPSSRHASAERAQELEVRWQSLASAEAFALAAKLATDAAARLRERQIPAAEEKIAAALGVFQEAVATYPRSRRQESALRRRLVYLDLRRGEIAGLQQSLLAALMPVPGKPNLRMLATEVPQRLYEKVMNHNPSHHRGPLLPVECVSWQEATAFCERVGWLLGRPVRLPDEAEFRATFAQQRGAPRGLAATGAHSRPIPGAGQEPEGFSDLRGNVAEWLAATTPTTAPVAGGSYLAAEIGPDLPIAEQPKSKRAPHIGFRFVVE